MNIFKEEEFFALCEKLGTTPRIKEVTIEYDTDSYFNKVKEAVATDRRGEVVFCVIRPNDRIITVTSEEYPKGIFRIPTGGIGYEEDVLEAVSREAKEELGLETEIMEFGGVLKIKFQHKEEAVMFYSYLFILREKSGRLLEDATDDEVSQVREVDMVELELVARGLLNLKGRWSDWGRFRYETSNATLEILRNLRW